MATLKLSDYKDRFIVKETFVKKKEGKQAELKTFHCYRK